MLQYRMSLPEIMIVAVGLAMDSFAVSITLGLSVQKPKLVEYLIPGIYFGLFHVFMPLVGYFAGTYFAAKIQQFDHWIAFALLGFVGGKMIKVLQKTKKMRLMRKRQTRPHFTWAMCCYCRWRPA